VEHHETPARAPPSSLGAWGIIGVGSTDFALVQVKTRDWPGSVETENLKSVDINAIQKGTVFTGPIPI